MPIHNKSHRNHALMYLNAKRRSSNVPCVRNDMETATPNESKICLSVTDCLDFLNGIPDKSVQLICIDPPYNPELAQWDVYDNYIAWASKWIGESYRVLADDGNMAVFGGTQFRDVKSGDLVDIIHHVRRNTQFKLINKIIWHYPNGMSARRYFANRYEEIVWLAKSNSYYFDLDAVREPYSEKNLEAALRDKRLNPKNTQKGKNPTNVWRMNRLNGNSGERVGHPTQKPAAVIERLVKALSRPGDVVLDFFAGSGTTGRVCIATRRNCLMCDSDPAISDHFARHLELMRASRQNTNHISYRNPKGFFASIADRSSSSSPT